MSLIDRHTGVLIVKRKNKSHPLLIKICYLLSELYDQKQKNASISNVEALVVYNKNKIKVEIRCENSSHHKPHMHIQHTDKIDVSICLETFDKIAGQISEKMLRKIKEKLLPFQEELLDIWNELNENNDKASATLKISQLKIPKIKLLHKRLIYKNGVFKICAASSLAKTHRLKGKAHTT